LEIVLKERTLNSAPVLTATLLTSLDPRAIEEVSQATRSAQTYIAVEEGRALTLLGTVPISLTAVMDKADRLTRSNMSALARDTPPTSMIQANRATPIAWKTPKRVAVTIKDLLRWTLQKSMRSLSQVKVVLVRMLICMRQVEANATKELVPTAVPTGLLAETRRSVIRAQVAAQMTSMEETRSATKALDAVLTTSMETVSKVGMLTVSTLLSEVAGTQTDTTLEKDPAPVTNESMLISTRRLVSLSVRPTRTKTA